MQKALFPTNQAKTPYINIKDAMAMGIDEICFTDHVDYGIKQDWDRGIPIEYRGSELLANVNYPKYVSEIRRLQSLYGTEITIKPGLEFGIQVHTIPQYKALFSKYPFDFIILSIHQVEDKEFWTQDFQKGKNQKEYNEELLNVIKSYRDYSVIGHMDLITRYDKSGSCPFEKIKPIISEILKAAIHDSNGLEFNYFDESGLIAANHDTNHLWPLNQSSAIFGHSLPASDDIYLAVRPYTLAAFPQQMLFPLCPQQP